MSASQINAAARGLAFRAARRARQSALAALQQCQTPADVAALLAQPPTPAELEAEAKPLHNALISAHLHGRAATRPRK